MFFLPYVFFALCLFCLMFVLEFGIDVDVLPKDLNVHYPSAPDPEPQMCEYVIPADVSPLHVLGTDRVLTGIFGLHFVNVELVSFNSIVNCLNDKTVFSVFLELEPKKFVQFEMK